MKKHLTRILVLMTALAIGVLTTRSYYFWNVDFEYSGTSDGALSECEFARSWTVFYDSYDGERLALFTSMAFDSKTKAKECFEKLSVSLGKPISSEPIDSDSSSMGLLDRKITGRTEKFQGDELQMYTIIRLHDDGIQLIDSTSLRNAEIFEDRYLDQR